MSNQEYTDEPVVQVGHPDFQAQLSPGDEKRVDEKGRPVVLGLPWSEAATGLYLTVHLSAVQHGHGPKADRKVHGRSLGYPTKSGETPHALTLVVSLGKPRFSVGGWGASLELPSDLAQDALKVTYVTEWFLDTVREAVTNADLDPERLRALAGEMVLTVESAIRKAGL